MLNRILNKVCSQLKVYCVVHGSFSSAVLLLFLFKVNFIDENVFFFVSKRCIIDSNEILVGVC